MIRKPQVHTKAAAFQIALKRWLSRYRVTPSLMRGPVRIVGLDNVRQHQHVLHARAGGFHAQSSRARRHRVALALGWSGSCPAYTYYKYTHSGAQSCTLAIAPTMVWIMSGVHVLQVHAPWWCPGVARSWGEPRTQHVSTHTQRTQHVQGHAHAHDAAHVQVQGLSLIHI